MASRISLSRSRCTWYQISLHLVCALSGDAFGGQGSEGLTKFMCHALSVADFPITTDPCLG
jgi:hypothetical protein